MVNNFSLCWNLITAEWEVPWQKKVLQVNTDLRPMARYFWDTKYVSIKMPKHAKISKNKNWFISLNHLFTHHLLPSISILVRIFWLSKVATINPENPCLLPAIFQEFLQVIVEGVLFSQVHFGDIPSGKHTNNYGKSQCFMGKSTINGHFQ